MEALVEYRRASTGYDYCPRHPYAWGMPRSPSSPRWEWFWFMAVVGLIVGLGAWLVRKWNDWGLIAGFTRDPLLARIQLEHYIDEVSVVPFALLMLILASKYGYRGPLNSLGLSKICTLQTLEEAIVVAQPLLTWGENLLGWVVPTIPAGGSAETWVGLDPLYTWMLQDNLVGGYLEGSRG